MKKKKIILSIVLGVLSIIFIVLGVLLFSSVPNVPLTTMKEDLIVWGCIWSIVIGVGCLLGSIINLFVDGE